MKAAPPALCLLCVVTYATQLDLLCPNLIFADQLYINSTDMRHAGSRLWIAD